MPNLDMADFPWLHTSEQPSTPVWSMPNAPEQQGVSFTYDTPILPNQTMEADIPGFDIFNSDIGSTGSMEPLDLQDFWFQFGPGEVGDRVEAADFVGSRRLPVSIVRLCGFTPPYMMH